MNPNFPQVRPAPLIDSDQELFLGGTTQSLLHLGKLLADTPVNA